MTAPLEAVDQTTLRLTPPVPVAFDAAVSDLRNPLMQLMPLLQLRQSSRDFSDRDVNLDSQDVLSGSRPALP
jgi:hypothetical protein